jgi:polyisoprenoid-binding protein YceI
MQLNRFAFLLFAACSLTLPIHAQEELFQVDAAASHVGFTLGDVLHTVKGVFQVDHGAIRYNSATGLAGGEVVVQAASGDSGGHARDHRMHEQILESVRFPQIAFTPSRVRGQLAPQGDSKVEIDGTFTLVGAGHPLTVTAVVHREGDRFRASTHFPVPYVKWGLKNPSTFLLKVNDHVDIDLELVGSVKIPR